MVISSLGIFVANPIQSLLWLILVFLLSSVILIKLGSEFLAILLIVVYVGAISVLFLFVIMLLNIRKVELYNYYINFLPIFFFICLFFLLEVLNVIFNKNSIINIVDYSIIDYHWINSLYYTSNIEVIGFLFFDLYFYYFLFLSFILLIALLGTLMLLVSPKYSKNFIEYYKKRLD